MLTDFTYFAKLIIRDFIAIQNGFLYPAKENSLIF